MMPSCTDCRFAEPVLDEDNGNPFLQCRRYPPSMEETNDGELTVQFPSVLGADWCGEFRSKPGDAPPATTLSAVARRLVRRLRGDTL